MGSIIESLSLTVILILIVLFIGHLMNGDAIEWLKTKFQAQDAGAK